MLSGYRCALAGMAGAVALAILVAALEGSLAAMPATGVNNGALVNRSHKTDRLQTQSDARPTLSIAKPTLSFRRLSQPADRVPGCRVAHQHIFCRGGGPLRCLAPPLRH